MEEYICLFLCVSTIVLLRIIFKINLKKAKELEKDDKLQEITDRFPQNIEVAEEMLEMLGNKDVKIEQEEDTKTSLYIAVSNKILIADFKSNYARIGTIAHECMHSVQDRMLLMFNFVFSNIVLLYFIIAVILTVCNVFTNHILQLFVLLLLSLIQFSVRSYLEIDAMTKSKYLAKEYIEYKNLCSKEEVNNIINKYDIINKMGIYFYIYKLITNSLIRIILYSLVCIFVK